MKLEASGLQVLSRLECLELMATADIGRIVFTDRALPATQPVNFCLDRLVGVRHRARELSTIPRRWRV